VIRVIILDLDDTLIDTSSLEPLRSAGRWRDIPRYFNGCAVYQSVVGLVTTARSVGIKVAIFSNAPSNYVTIKANPDSIPVQPTLGQHWSVKGTRQIENMEVGDYVMQQHTYESPKHVECILPETGEQLIRFIARESDFKGIGESKARVLWQLLGKDFHATLRNDTPESRKRLTSILSEDSVEALFKGYAKYKNLAHCNWMSEHSIPASVQQRLLKHHGEASIEVIKDNPYALMGFGLSFSAIEDIIKVTDFKSDVAKDDSRRLSAALEMAIRKEIEKGHTYTTHANVRPYLNNLLKDKTLVTQAFKSGHDKAQYILNPDTGTYHPTAQLLMESVVAKRLNTLIKRNDLFDENKIVKFVQSFVFPGQTDDGRSFSIFNTSGREIQVGGKNGLLHLAHRKSVAFQFL
jgi:exodeoxyribonuclease V alpha subunit